MVKVLWSSAAGVGAALVVMTAFFLGARLSPVALMMSAAALSVGAAVAVMTKVLLETPPPKKSREKFLATRIRDMKGLIDAFPKGSGAVQLSIRSDTVPDDLDIVKNPDKYVDKDVIVTIKEGAKTFNPITLKKIFQALKQQPNFVHMMLVDKHDEFVGYIPSLRVKSDFTGDDAEGLIARNIVDVFTEHANSANLRGLNGLANTDTISDEESLSKALDKMQGGFLRLVVLRGGYHRKPIGLLHSEQLMSATKSE